MADGVNEAAEIERLRHAIDRDRYIVAAAVGGIRKAIAGRAWLLERRGLYEWDDEHYREEFGAALRDIEAAVEPLSIVGWDKSDCTRIEERVEAARIAARTILAQPVRKREMIAADLGLPCPACNALQSPTDVASDNNRLSDNAADVKGSELADGEALHWLEPYRTVDASGSPDSAGRVGWDWLSDLAQQERASEAVMLEIQCSPLDNDGKAAVLYRSTKPIAAYFVIRDVMNFAVLFRWQRTALRSRTVDDGLVEGNHG